MCRGRGEKMNHSTAKANLSPGAVPEAWTVREEEYPADGTALEQLRFLVRYAILAPSNQNSQPWIWREDGEGLRLYADKTRQLVVADPCEQDMLISCGASLGFLAIAAHYFGHELQIERVPDHEEPYYLARVELGPDYPLQEDDALLFTAMLDRHTNRGNFEERDVPLDLLQELERDATGHGVWLGLIQSPDSRDALVNLILRGDLELWQDPSFAAEMAGWIREHEKSSGDGIPAKAQGYNKLEAHVMPVAMRVPALGRLMHLQENQAERDWLLAGKAPVLAVLGTLAMSDSDRDRVVLGEALAKILLRASAAGLAASFFNSPVKMPYMWPRIFRITGHNAFVHLIFRLGYPREAAVATPRRPLEDVLVK